MTCRIATWSDQPELGSLLAAWRVAAFFGYPGGYTVEKMTALILEPSVGPKGTFVLFARDKPVGTAALIDGDLETRPDLTPWLAGLLVQPAFRGRGYATALVRRVEAFAMAASVPVLWLHTATAEPLYAKAGLEARGPGTGKRLRRGADATLFVRGRLNSTEAYVDRLAQCRNRHGMQSPVTHAFACAPKSLDADLPDPPKAGQRCPA